MSHSLKKIRILAYFRYYEPIRHKVWCNNKKLRTFEKCRTPGTKNGIFILICVIKYIFLSNKTLKTTIQSKKRCIYPR